jgi:hypothetical protein
MENFQSFFNLFNCRLEKASDGTIWICCERGSDLEFYIAGDENKPNLNLQKEAIRILKVFKVVEARVKKYLTELKEFEQIDLSPMRFDYLDYPNHVSMWQIEWIELSHIEHANQYQIYCSLSDGDLIHGTDLRDAFTYIKWAVLIQNDMPISCRMVVV